MATTSPPPSLETLLRRGYSSRNMPVPDDGPAAVSTLFDVIDAARADLTHAEAGNVLLREQRAELQAELERLRGERDAALQAYHDELRKHAATDPVQDASAPMAEWCIVELMGHRRLAGHVREVQIAGAGFLRLDIPAAGQDAARTQFIAPASVYALHPTDEATGRRAAAVFRPEPVQRWQLTAEPATAAPAAAEFDDDDPSGWRG